MASVEAIPLLPLSDEELEALYGDAPDGVRANMVQSVDGAGAFHGRTKQITDPADQQLLLHLRGHADAVLVGAATVQAERYGPVRLDEAMIAIRRAAGYADLPPLVVVTRRSVLPTDLRIFGQEGPRPIVATLRASAEKADQLREVADVIVAGDDQIEPGRILATLRERGMSRVLCEGGPFLLSQLIESDLIDDMCLTVSPYLAGSQPTTPQPASAREVPTRLRLRHVLTRNDLLYVRYSRS
jgi:riboflavin biosynthesis pyrimidine reductase